MPDRGPQSGYLQGLWDGQREGYREGLRDGSLAALATDFSRWELWCAFWSPRTSAISRGL